MTAMMTMKETTVREGFLGALYEDGVFQKTLKPGRYKFEVSKLPGFLKALFGKEDDVQRQIIMVDTRNRSLTLKGQEILTADKVAVADFDSHSLPSHRHRVSPPQSRILRGPHL